MQSLTPIRRASTALLLLLLIFPALTDRAQTPVHNSPWLFAGFKNDSKDGVYYAISLDGFHWKLANGGKPVIPPTETGELMRDPFIQRAPDGGFRMVWTWAWYERVIGYSESKDLLTWTPHRQLSVMANEPEAVNVWAPALYYDAAEKRWLIYWSSAIPGRYPGDDSGDTATLPNGSKVLLNHRIYFTTTPDFIAFSPARVFFNPGHSVIDATLLPPQSPKAPFTIIYKDERKTPLEKHLLTATAPSIDGPWSNVSQPISETWSEGAAIIPVGATASQPAGYLAYYDHYSQGQHYGAVFSTDLVHWFDALSKIDFPAGMRHGSFLKITQAEYDRLAALNASAVPQASGR
jgi:hypothetical protein